MKIWIGINHINDWAAKLNRANALLFQIRNYVNHKVLRSTYIAIFDSHLIYANAIWAQNSNAIQQITILHKRAIRKVSFQPWNSHSSPFFFRKIIDLTPSKIKWLLTDKFIKSHWFVYLLNIVHFLWIHNGYLYCSIYMTLFSSTIQLLARNWI